MSWIVPTLGAAATPATGDALRWNGSGWQPQPDAYRLNFGNLSFTGNDNSQISIYVPHGLGVAPDYFGFWPNSTNQPTNLYWSATFAASQAPDGNYVYMTLFWAQVSGQMFYADITYYYQFVAIASA